MNPNTNENTLQNTNQQAGQGYLIIHVSTARGAIPLEDAQVSIRNYLKEPTEERGNVIATLVSGTDGNTARIPLSAPPRSSTLKPGNGSPFTPYIAEVRLEGYYDQTYSSIPVFDGITAIQPADLIPLPENGQSDSFTPDSSRDFENTAPNL